MLSVPCSQYLPNIILSWGSLYFFFLIVCWFNLSTQFSVLMIADLGTNKSAHCPLIGGILSLLCGLEDAWN